MARRTLSTWDASGKPYLSVDNDFGQLEYNEQFNAIAINIILSKLKSANGIIILYGCVDTISGGNHNISAGAVYNQGEIFICPAQIFPVVVGTVVVANLSVTYDPSDPIVYADFSSHSPHQIRQVSLSTGVSGSGMFESQVIGGSFTSTVNDLTNFVNLNSVSWIPTPTLTIFASGGGSFTGYTVSYSKYKIDTDGKTFIWQARISGGTISGTVNFLQISFSSPLNRTYANALSSQFNASWDLIYPIDCLLTGSDVTIQLFQISPGSGVVPFNVGYGDINFSITAELN